MCIGSGGGDGGGGGGGGNGGGCGSGSGGRHGGGGSGGSGDVGSRDGRCLRIRQSCGLLISSPMRLTFSNNNKGLSYIFKHILF